MLADKYHVSSISLFGSILRDDYAPATSDIDTIVEFSKPIGVEFIDFAYYIEKSLNKRIDLVTKKGINKNYFAQKKREIIYI